MTDLSPRRPRLVPKLEKRSRSVREEGACLCVQDLVAPSSVPCHNNGLLISGRKKERSNIDCSSSCSGVLGACHVEIESEFGNYQGS